MLGLIIFALMIGVIWLEIKVFGIIGDEIGVLLTIIGVFVTAALGLRLLRSSGRATMQRMAQSVQAGRPPILDVADGVAILAGAGLLLIPGYATDAMGLILFIPGLRTVLVIALYGLLRPFASRFSSRSSFQFSSPKLQYLIYIPQMPFEYHLMRRIRCRMKTMPSCWRLVECRRFEYQRCVYDF